MADTDYIFHISPYDTEKLLPQVSRALEKRTEIDRKSTTSELQSLMRISYAVFCLKRHYHIR